MGDLFDDGILDPVTLSSINRALSVAVPGRDDGFAMLRLKDEQGDPAFSNGVLLTDRVSDEMPGTQ